MIYTSDDYELQTLQLVKGQLHEHDSHLTNLSPTCLIFLIHMQTSAREFQLHISD